MGCWLNPVISVLIDWGLTVMICGACDDVDADVRNVRWRSESDWGIIVWVWGLSKLLFDDEATVVMIGRIPLIFYLKRKKN